VCGEGRAGDIEIWPAVPTINHASGNPLTILFGHPEEHFVIYPHKIHQKLTPEDFETLHQQDDAPLRYNPDHSEEFNPKRYEGPMTKSALSKICREIFLTFSSGSRNCLGRDSVIDKLKLALTLLSLQDSSTSLTHDPKEMYEVFQRNTFDPRFFAASVNPTTLNKLTL
jgi:Cytochrome P450.